MVETHRVRSPEERRRLELARRRHARRFRRIEDLRRRGPQFIMVLLCLLAISLILYRFFGPELLQAEDEAISDTFVPTETASTTDVRVDPDLLRSEIEAFERTLFGAESARSLGELASGISTEATVLADKARDMSGSRPRLAEIANRVGQIGRELSDASIDLDRLGEVRREWTDLRTRVFHRASWFTSPAVDMASDTSSEAAYRDAASSLLSLVESARSEAEYFSERVAEGEEIREEWIDFESQFSADLRDVELTVPAERPGTGASTRLLAAIQKLERAIDLARERVAVEIPGHPLDSGPYDRAVDAAQEASDAFE